MLDANVLIAGTVWPRWPYEVLQHARRGDFQLILSPLLIRQARRHLEARFPDHAGTLVETLQSISPIIVSDPSPAQVARNVSLSRDITDVPVALAAINAKVDYLVGEDKDLTAQDDTTPKLRKRLRVMTAGTVLREARGWTSEQLKQVRGRTWRDLEAAEEVTEWQDTALPRPARPG